MNRMRHNKKDVHRCTQYCFQEGTGDSQICIFIQDWGNLNRDKK